MHPNLTLNVSIDHSFSDDHVTVAIGDVQLTDAWKCELITSEKATKTSVKMPQPTVVAKSAIAGTLLSSVVSIKSDSAALLVVLCFVALLSSGSDLGHAFLSLHTFIICLLCCYVFLFFFYFVHVRDCLLSHTGLTISIS